MPSAAPSATLVRRLSVAILVLGVLGAGVPLAAQTTGDSRWLVRVQALGLFPQADDLQVPIPQGTASIDLSEDAGFGLDLEFRPTRHLGIEAAYLVGDIQADFRVQSGGLALSASEPIDTEILSLGLNYHFTPEGRIDLFAGVLVAQSSFEGVVFSSGQGLRTKRAFDDDVGFGVKAGVAVPLGTSGRWSFDAQLRYLATLLEAERGADDDVDLDLFVPSVGIAYHF